MNRPEGIPAGQWSRMTMRQKQEAVAARTPSAKPSSGTPEAAPAASPPARGLRPAISDANRTTRYRGPTQMSRSAAPDAKTREAQSRIPGSGASTPAPAAKAADKPTVVSSGSRTAPTSRSRTSGDKPGVDDRAPRTRSRVGGAETATPPSRPTARKSASSGEPKPKDKPSRRASSSSSSAPKDKPSRPAATPRAKPAAKPEKGKPPEWFKKFTKGGVNSNRTNAALLRGETGRSRR